MERMATLPPDVKVLVVPGAGTVLLSQKKQLISARRDEMATTQGFQARNQGETFPSRNASMRMACFGHSLGSVPETCIPSEYNELMHQQSQLEDQWDHFGSPPECTLEHHHLSANISSRHQLGSRVVRGAESPSYGDWSNQSILEMRPPSEDAFYYPHATNQVSTYEEHEDDVQDERCPWNHHYLPQRQHIRAHALEREHTYPNGDNIPETQDVRRRRLEHSEHPQFLHKYLSQGGAPNQNSSIVTDRDSGVVTLHTEVDFEPDATFDFEHKFRNKFILHSIQVSNSAAQETGNRVRDGTDEAIISEIRTRSSGRHTRLHKTGWPGLEVTSDGIFDLLKQEISPILGTSFYMPLSQVFQPPAQNSYSELNLGGYTDREAHYSRLVAEMPRIHARAQVSSQDTSYPRGNNLCHRNNNLEKIGTFMEIDFGPFLDGAREMLSTSVSSEDSNSQRDFTIQASPRLHEHLEPATIFEYFEEPGGPVDGFDGPAQNRGNQEAPQPPTTLDRFLRRLRHAEDAIFSSEFYDNYVDAHFDDDSLFDSSLEDSDQGLPLYVLESLPVVSYESKCMNSSEEQDLCTICLVPLEEKQKIKKLRCKHFFHPGCIDRWLGKHNCCPLCKQTAAPPGM